ncbi:MAG: FeoB-associated Cys-rich membrane protein [Flavobacteriaceae bacterium TMED147]|nr:MAG: FeoB-associated Cys-rich membrane protein [Flavobacteriaceae bacterium TMED147]
MDWIQTILVIISASSAFLFLFRKFLFKKKVVKGKGCETDCNCH